MRIEIHRWRMAMSPRNDGRVAVGYDVLVPLEDCVPKNSSNIEVLHGDRRYMHYPHATWSTDLPPCWTRYEAWLAHEREAERQMLRFLHDHCPETHELDEWPTLWAYIDPEHANDLHTVHVTIPPAAAAPPSAGAAARSTEPRQQGRAPCPTARPRPRPSNSGASSTPTPAPRPLTTASSST